MAGHVSGFGINESELLNMLHKREEARQHAQAIDIATIQGAMKASGRENKPENHIPGLPFARTEVIPYRPSEAIGDLPEINREPQHIIGDLLEVNPGVFLGESHYDKKAPESFLSDNMALFKAHGVNTLYTEMFQQKNQKDLDHYMETGEVRPDLDSFLNKQVERWEKPGTMRGIMEEARKQGVRIVGLEGEVVTGQNKSHVAREEDWHKAIKANPPEEDGKYILYAGSDHSSDFKDGYRAIDYRPGIPSVEILEMDKRPKWAGPTTYQANSPETSSHFDFITLIPTAPSVADMEH